MPSRAANHFWESASACSGFLREARKRQKLRALRLFSGECSRFPASVKSPHVGWNQLEVRPGSRLLKGVNSGAFVYYTHSYRAPVIAETTACTNYGGAFSAAVERDNVFGVQFHPEKSAEAGLKILENFCAF